jgi:hypothetical protein
VSGLASWAAPALARAAATADAVCFALGFFWLLASLTGIDPMELRREVSAPPRRRIPPAP